MLHEYELVARGTVVCYGYPNTENCSEAVTYEVDIDGRAAPDDGDIEDLIDDVLAAQGWYGFCHPGGMRYAEQWYCPSHAQMIIDEPDKEAELERNGQLRHYLWPDPSPKPPVP